MSVFSESEINTKGAKHLINLTFLEFQSTLNIKIMILFLNMRSYKEEKKGSF